MSLCGCWYFKRIGGKLQGFSRPGLRCHRTLLPPHSVSVSRSQANPDSRLRKETSTSSWAEWQSCKGAHLERAKKFMVACSLAVFPIGLSPGLAIPFLAFVSHVCLGSWSLTLDCLHSSALLLLAECADRSSVSALYHWALITLFLSKKIEDNRYDLTQIPTYLSNALVFYSDPYHLPMLCLMPLLKSLLVFLLSYHLINCDFIVNSQYLFPFIIIWLLSCPHLVHSSEKIDSQ